MPFIIAKDAPTKWNQSRKLYYFVENYRFGTKIKRKTILALGEARTLEEYLHVTQQEEMRVKKRLAETEATFDRFCKYGVVPALHNPRYPTLFRRKFLKFIEEDKKILEEYGEKIKEIQLIIDSTPNVFDSKP